MYSKGKNYKLNRKMSGYKTKGRRTHADIDTSGAFPVLKEEKKFNQVYKVLVNDKEVYKIDQLCKAEVMAEIAENIIYISGGRGTVTIVMGVERA